MSGLTMIIVGLVLGIAGGWSFRTVMLAAGFGAGWLLASVFGATFLIAMVIAVAGALTAWLVLRLAATIVFFILGALVGLLVGARLYRLIEGGDGNLVLAIVFIPAIGVVGGWLAEKSRERFVAWGTSIAGAALVLSGLGVLVGALSWLRDPENTWQSVVGVASWVALALGFRLVQKVVGSGDLAED
ncbi:MAG: hypothetical protein WBL35_03710 [Ornithinibacter sp.]